MNRNSFLKQFVSMGLKLPNWRSTGLGQKRSAIRRSRTAKWFMHVAVSKMDRFVLKQMPDYGLSVDLLLLSVCSMSDYVRYLMALW